MALVHNVGEFVSNAPFEWKIHAYHLHSVKKGDQILSPKFFSDVNKEEKDLYISMCPKGDYESSDGYMALYLNNDNDEDVTLTYSFALMTSNGEKIRTVKLENQKIESKTGYGWADFIMQLFVLNPVNDLIEENQITIVCTIHEDSKGEEITSHIGNPWQQMIENIFQNRKYSDITITAADRETYFLHRCILAEQSSVFEAMFDTDMLEKKENLVKIDDFESAVLNEFFMYIYTGQVGDDFLNLAGDILNVAEKYNVVKLKDRCEMAMSLNLNTDNAIDYFKVADTHCAKKLRSNAVRYMAFHLRIFNKKPEFKSLTTHNLVEIIDCHLDFLAIEEE